MFGYEPRAVWAGLWRLLYRLVHRRANSAPDA